MTNTEGSGRQGRAGGECPNILRKLTTIENKLDSLSTIETKLDRIIQEK